MGGGSYPYVYALAVSGTDLYAGGDFTTSGGSAVNCVAKWDGSAWSALGSGMGAPYPYASPYVYALAVSGTNLYVGGSFTYATNAGAITVNVTNIARWDGSAWSALGPGINYRVWALAVSGTDLYAGATSSTAGGNTVGYVAKWNGSTWSPVGGGMDDQVCALAVSGSDLYAGGYFTYASNAGPKAVKVNGIAKWNGSVWTALSSGVGGDFLHVNALAVSGTDLYAGGYFTTAGGVVANYIAKWNGSAWSALGSGMNDPVNALAVSGTNLYAGGNFTTAGNKVSAYAALAHVSAAAGRFSSVSYSPATGCRFTFSDATVGQPYRIQNRWSLTGGSWTDLIGFTYPGPVIITDYSTLSATNKFYRTVSP
jgi:hypothetical protein